MNVGPVLTRLACVAVAVAVAVPVGCGPSKEDATPNPEFKAPDIPPSAKRDAPATPAKGEPAKIKSKQQ